MPAFRSLRKGTLVGIGVCAFVLGGCLGGDEQSEHDEPGAELPADLPPADATRPAHRATQLPPLGRIPPGSVRVSGFAPGQDTNHFDATVVAYLPGSWQLARPEPSIGSWPRFPDGLGPDLVFSRGSRRVAVAVCGSRLPGSAEQTGLDEHTGEQAASDAAEFYNRAPVGSLEQPKPPRLGPRLYRGAHLIVVGFRGGGCLYLGDPDAPDPTVSKRGFARSPDETGRALERARRRALSPHLLEVAKRTTAFWGRRPRLPASNRLAEAIARRAQRAVMSAPRLRYEEQFVFCRDGSGCRETEAGENRLVERERASGFVFADYARDGAAERTLIVRRGDSVWQSGSGDCWSPDAHRGSFSGGFLFRGSFSRGDDRARFFPPLERWRLAYEPPRATEPGRTELRWRSYFDRGRAIVDDATLRLLRIERVVRATVRASLKRTVSFTYPATIDPVRPTPACSDEDS